jgi:membrane fusion protein, heavy metal efflux system
MNVKIIIVLVFSMLVISCKDKTEQTVNNDSGLIGITKAQFESEKMVFGEPELYPFSDKVHFTGAIVPSIDGQAQISLPLPGIIENILCKPTQMVSKGSVLFEISGHWFIDLQKDYSQSSALLSKLKGDYLRAKELYDQNIGTQKDFTAAESNYYAENAKHKALKTKLESMGLDVSKIENGEFFSSFPVKSPITGYISSINASVGQYIAPQQTIASLIDNNSFQLKLAIFEKEIHKIKIGQKVRFYLNANKSQKYQTKLNAIGKTIMPDTKSIECYAAIDRPGSINMVNNQFVEGEVFTSIDSVLAVPETAIIESENELYVLRYEKEDDSTYYFKKVKVKTGRKNNNYIELTEQLPSKKLLVNGTYNIVIE